MSCKVLVTGATGFVGSNIALRLVELGYQVRALRRATSRLDALGALPVEHFVGDVLDELSLARAVQGCSMVFHAAGAAQYWRVSRDVLYRVNVGGTRTVMAACLEAGVDRVVHVSSIAALGCRKHGALVDEHAGFPPELVWWSYGHSKHLAEEEVRGAMQQGLSAVIVNPGIILGPRDVNFVSGSLLRASSKGQLRIVPPGGSNVVHVDDVAAGAIAAAMNGREGERYILGGENLSHYEMAAVLSEVTGGPPPLLTLPGWSLGAAAGAVDLFNRFRRPPPLLTGEQVRLGGETFYADNRKAVNELGLQPKRFREAAKDAFTWYKEHSLL